MIAFRTNLFEQNLLIDNYKKALMHFNDENKQGDIISDFSRSITRVISLTATKIPLIEIKHINLLSIKVCR